jgi:hypothetical protein
LAAGASSPGGDEPAAVLDRQMPYAEFALVIDRAVEFRHCEY